MGLTGVVKDLMAPVQLQAIRPVHPGALHLEDMRPVTRVTIVTPPVPAGTAQYLQSTDPEAAEQLQPPRMERRDIIVLGFPTFQAATNAFYITALVQNLEGYADLVVRTGWRKADSERFNLASMGVMPYIQKPDGRLLWEPRTYTVRTPSGRAIPEAFEEDEAPVP